MHSLLFCFGGFCTVFTVKLNEIVVKIIKSKTECTFKVVKFFMGSFFFFCV